jgi:murein DD-endopeptidase MepM/ murein hydrolase activator NlpD
VQFDRRDGATARRWIQVTALSAVLGFILVAPAHAAVSHLVQPGETLWSISAANNLTTRTVAVFNGLPEDAGLLAGQTIEVPTVAEGEAALAAAGVVTDTTTAPAPASAGPPPPAPGSTLGLGHIPSAWGELHLDPAAADSWNAMRAASLEQLGIDLAPAGPLSAFRTYEQQAYLYDLYLAGEGAPANPPGSSTHEIGVSVDLADPVMRDAIDQLGPIYGWSAPIPTEWWHVQYVGG